MAPNDLPEEVKRLLREHISSVEQLEVLLLLRSRSSESFDRRTITHELRTSESSAAARLTDLAAQGFLAFDDTTESYRYAPQVDWFDRAVELLDTAYRDRRYRVVELIFSKPIENLRAFAGAFRFNKNKPDT